MNAYLCHVPEHLGPERHAVLIMDGAGWHISTDLAAPDNLTQLLLLPYSPEPNPVERPWACVRQHKMSSRVLPADEALDRIAGRGDARDPAGTHPDRLPLLVA